MGALQPRAKQSEGVNNEQNKQILTELFRVYTHAVVGESQAALRDTPGGLLRGPGRQWVAGGS